TNLEFRSGDGPRYDGDHGSRTVPPHKSIVDDRAATSRGRVRSPRRPHRLAYRRLTYGAVRAHRPHRHVRHRHRRPRTVRRTRRPAEPADTRLRARPTVEHVGTY